MRTTVTLAPDVERLLRQSMKEKGISLTQALNDAIRSGICGQESRGSHPFVQKAFHMGAEQLFRWDKALATVDAMENEELVRKPALRK